jgi:AraC-like DNA-binding protein
MSKTDINISKTNIIDKRCDEMFLPISRSSTFLDAGIHAGGISDLRGEYVISRKNPEFAVLIYTLRGGGKVSIDEQTENLVPGKFFYLPCGREHHYWIDGDEWRILWFHLIPEILSTSTKLKDKPLILKMAPPPQLEHLMIASIKHATTVESDDEAFRLYSNLMLNALLREFRAESSGIDMEIANRFSAVLAEIYAAPSKNWTVAAMARKSGLSEGHFRRLFKIWSGTPPLAKVIEAKMSHAANQLSNSDQRVEAIADNVGYANQFAFSKTFKRWKGLPPREYRQSLKNSKSS